MQNIDTSKLAFAPLTISAKGAKQLPALHENGEPVVFQADEFLDVPFEPSAFNDSEANRVSLCVTPSPSLCDQIAALDEWCIQTLSANPTNLLGIHLSPAQIKDRYVSCLRTSEKGYQTLRVKMNKSGRYALQCYTPKKERRDHPEIWKDCLIQPRLIFRGLWLMNKDVGMLLECAHGLIKEGSGADECPF